MLLSDVAKYVEGKGFTVNPPQNEDKFATLVFDGGRDGFQAQPVSILHQIYCGQYIQNYNTINL